MLNCRTIKEEHKQYLFAESISIETIQEAIKKPLLNYTYQTTQNDVIHNQNWDNNSTAQIKAFYFGSCQLNKFPPGLPHSMDPAGPDQTPVLSFVVSPALQAPGCGDGDKKLSWLLCACFIICILLEYKQCCKLGWAYRYIRRS